MKTAPSIQPGERTRWIDWFPARARWAAGIQVALLLLLLAYGLFSPSLGTHLLGPAVVTVAEFAALIWLTLTRPWDMAWYGRGDKAWFPWRWGICDPALLTWATLYLASIHRNLLGYAKEQMARALGSSALDPFAILGHGEAARAWAADPLGWGLAGAPLSVIVGIILPACILALLWFFLPR
ncbi:MAG: hypothetical protein ACC662_04985 [Planctomycetota bacterium]